MGHAPFDIPWTVFIAVPLLVIMHRHGPLRGFWLGWFAGFGYFLTVLHWIVEPFLVDLVRTGWMAPFALLLMTGGMALFWAAGLSLARSLVWAAGPRLEPVAVPLGLAAAELARSLVMTGFPWALPAYIWIETPISQVLAFVGPFGLTYLTLQVAALPVALRRPLVGIPVMVVLVLGTWVLGAQRPPEGYQFSETLVRLVQPNAPQREKWDPEKAGIFWQRQLDATGAPGDVNVVIWPEVAVPYRFDEAAQYNEMIAAQKPGANFIFGSIRQSRETKRFYNSMAILNGNGAVQSYYDKAHLVPFGEYLPFPDLWEKWGLYGLAANAGQYSAGAGHLIGAVDALPAFIPAICYEIIFSEEIVAANPNARWIVHVTNDAWFGNFSGPYQHFAQTRARAIETGLPVARAANTGISAMIDPYGRLVASLDLGMDGHIDAPLPAPLPQTWYSAMPQIAPLALILPFLFFGMVAYRRD